MSTLEKEILMLNKHRENERDENKYFRGSSHFFLMEAAAT
jgi:hypothetical protein